jgi:methionyl-tRNA synthetase
MLWAAGEELPKQVFGHGFVQRRDESGELVRESKTLGNVTDPMEIISKFSAEAFRYYFLRECPYPADGEFGWGRFAEVYNSELANNLGNLFSREMTITLKNFDGVFDGTAGRTPEPVVPGLDLALFVGEVREHVEACRYNLALQKIVQDFLTPTNQYLESHAPWKLVKTDKDAAKRVLFNAVQSLRIASILLKPFIPKSAETIYTGFNFPKPWAEVSYADAAELKAQPDDLRVTAKVIDNKVPPLFPRIG